MARPALRTGTSERTGAAACQGDRLMYAVAFGCFDLLPAAGTAIARNYGRGPAAVNLGMRISRTWSFGREAPSGAAVSGVGGHGTPSVAGIPAGRGVTLSASTLNALNHPNFAPPNGNLSSPYFGQYRTLGGMIVMSHGGGASTYNRKID